MTCRKGVLDYGHVPVTRSERRARQANLSLPPHSLRCTLNSPAFRETETNSEINPTLHETPRNLKGRSCPIERCVERTPNSSSYEKEIHLGFNRHGRGLDDPGRQYFLDWRDG